MTEAEIRAYVLAAAADDQTGPSAVYARGLHDDGKMWQIGSLRFWKSEAYKRIREANRSAEPFPSYRRASLQWSLLPDMRIEGERFTMNDGRRAIAILLRSEKDPEGTFGTFAVDEDEAARIIALLNSEMNATRAVATDCFRASGGDPDTVASQRAPSMDEMFTVLKGLLGDPDEDHDDDEPATTITP